MEAAGKRAPANTCSNRPLTLKSRLTGSFCFGAVGRFGGFELDVFQDFLSLFGRQIGEEVKGDAEVGVVVGRWGVVYQPGFAEDEFLGVAQRPRYRAAEVRAGRTIACQNVRYSRSAQVCPAG